MNKKPVIGISPNYSYDKKEYSLHEDYVLVIEKAGHRHLVLQLGHTLLAGLDGERIAQVVHGGLKSAQIGFQFINGDHISITP